MDRRVSPKPMPEGAMRALQWIADHACEYKGQWVVIDGDRLIAHGANADEVFDAAEADSANQPLVGFVDALTKFALVSEAKNFCSPHPPPTTVNNRGIGAPCSPFFIFAGQPPRPRFKKTSI